MSGSARRLRSKSRQVQFDFLKAEVEAGLNFARLAITEYGFDPPAVERALTYARTARDVLVKHLDTVALNERDRRWLKKRFEMLVEAIEELERPSTQ